MPGYKANRTAEDIKREIAAVIRELKDPRVNTSLLTVVRTEVAQDLSYAKVFISSLGGIAEAKIVCKALNTDAKGYIRREIGGRLSLRKTPDLRFIADDSVEKSVEMFRKLEKVKKVNDDENRP